MTDSIKDVSRDIVSTDVEPVRSSTEIDGAAGSVSAHRDGEIRMADEMDEAVVAKIRENVPKVLDKFKQDRNSIDSFGHDTLKKLNGQVDASLEQYREDGAAKSKEVNDILRSMAGDFEDVTKNYGTFAVDKHVNGFVGWVRSKFNGVRKWNYDRKDVLEKFNLAEAKLAGQVSVLTDNITRGEFTIEQNHKAQFELVRLAVAVELVRDQASDEVREIETKQDGLTRTDLEWNELQQQKARLASIIHELDEKHSEYVSSIFSAYYTAEQMNNIIQLSQEMKSKTRHIINTNIPDMKRVISQIDMMMQARDSAEIGDRVSQADRKINELGDKVMTEGTAYVANIAESPTITPEQIRSKVESIIKQNNEMVSAMEEGSKKRLEVERAAIKGINDIGASVRERNDRLVNTMLHDVMSEDGKAIGNASDGAGMRPAGGKDDTMDGLETTIIDA